MRADRRRSARAARRRRVLGRAARKAHRSRRVALRSANGDASLNTLASDFSALMPFVFGVPVVLLMALASFFPSARGPWTGPARATPLILLGGAFIAMQTDLGSLAPGVWPFLLGPIALSGASVVVWGIC